MSFVKRLHTVSEKLKVTCLAEEVSNHAAGYKYNIPEWCKTDLRKKKEKLMDSSKSRRVFCGEFRSFLK